MDLPVTGFLLAAFVIEDALTALQITRFEINDLDKVWTWAKYILNIEVTEGHSWTVNHGFCPMHLSWVLEMVVSSTHYLAINALLKHGHAILRDVDLPLCQKYMYTIE